MVKGISRRVVVIEPPDQKLFEQAIFIVREDYRAKERGGSGDILREAQDVADRYIQSALLPGDRGLWQRIPLWARIAGIAAAAAGLTSLL